MICPSQSKADLTTPRPFFAERKYFSGILFSLSRQNPTASIAGRPSHGACLSCLCLNPSFLSRTLSSTLSPPPSPPSLAVIPRAVLPLLLLTLFWEYLSPQRSSFPAPPQALVVRSFRTCLPSQAEWPLREGLASHLPSAHFPTYILFSGAMGSLFIALPSYP